MPLGDLKPSQLFNEMKRVAGNSLCDAVLLDLWASRLPPHASAAEFASRGDAVDKVAIADAIVDSLGLRSINAVEMCIPKQSVPGNNIVETPAVSTIEALQREVAQLSKRLDKFLPVARIPRGRSSSRNRSRARFRETTPAHITYWYHRTFGNDARRCRKPCGFGQTSTNAVNQQ